MKGYFVLIFSLIQILPNISFGQNKYLPQEFIWEPEIQQISKQEIAPVFALTSNEEEYDPSSSAFEEAIKVEKAIPIKFEPRRIGKIKLGPVFHFNQENSGVQILPDTVLIDSVWIRIASYYHKWDSDHVDPYQFDILKFKDTMPILLYDSTRGMGWAMPQKQYYKTSVFGPRGWRFHYGVDLKIQTGDTLRTVWDGVVRAVSYDRRGYGNYVVVRHLNGLETVYAHMSKRLVKPGQYVKAGELLGLGGSTGRSTGPHLHFEIRYYGNPINPEYIFDFSENWTIKDSYFLLTPDAWNHLRERTKTVYYRVRRGDSLGKIANRNGVSITYICRLNGIRKSSTLRVGQRLRVR